MIRDRPYARERMMLADIARLWRALRDAGCDPDRAERVTRDVIVARYVRPPAPPDAMPAGRDAAPTEPERDWVEGRWVPIGRETDADLTCDAKD